jgi:8-oxo-dGTP pyrophosphatase MutT (NUDIX family)
LSDKSDGVMVKRQSARVLLVDEMSRVLLLSGIDRTKPDIPPWWFAVGGGLEPGESPSQAAVREVYEETGLRIVDPGPVVFAHRFRWDFEGTDLDQEEWFFVVRTGHFEPLAVALTEVETATLRGFRWWSLDELRPTTEGVYPETIVEILDTYLR